MRTLYFMLIVGFLGMTSCMEEGMSEQEFTKLYTERFANRTTVSVDISSTVDGEYYAVYYENPYDEDMICKEPALMGYTPINTTLDVPKDVEKFYIIGGGRMRVLDAGNIQIVPSRAVVSRAADSNPVSDEVMTAINSVYFPEKPFNVRNENLFNCTDLVISETAQVWLTFLGDGGFRQSNIYGMLWFYTYSTSKQDNLKTNDCTFYGVKNGEVTEIKYNDIESQKYYVFYSKEEIVNDISSYKRYLLGQFNKGLSVGFVFIGNSGFRFSTPRLNPQSTVKLNYTDTGKSFDIKNKYVANGFIRHISVGGFQGNVLGMENRLVTESQYDGDYNDMICLVESNPVTLSPSQPIPDPEPVIESKTLTGLYLFEDNYPNRGDFDFNDAVIEYKIIDYYKTSNKMKQVTVRVLATGAELNNEFGFVTSKGAFSSYLTGLKGYANVDNLVAAVAPGEAVTQTVYGDIYPCLLNGRGYYIYTTTVGTAEYPCVLDIPMSDSSWQFAWPQENRNIDDCYYFLKNQSGGSRASDWYKTVKNPELVYKR